MASAAAAAMPEFAGAQVEFLQRTSGTDSRRPARCDPWMHQADPLDMYCTVVEDGVIDRLIDSLSSLVHLQHLSVRCLWQVDGTATEYTLRGFSDVTLPRLKHLTHLTLHGVNDRNLLQLQHLSSLSWLLLKSAGDTAVGPHSVPGMRFPASLQSLFLWSPAEAGLLSLFPPGLQALRVYNGVEGPGEVPSAILACLARLQNLTELSLWPGYDLDWPPAGPIYAALTASSCLAYLEVAAINWPESVWPHVVSAALPNLTCLKIASRDDEDDVLPMPLLGRSDFIRLVSCCPGLCEIQDLPLKPGWYVSLLSTLTALTCVDAYVGPDDVGHLGRCLTGFADVTQLRSLWVILDSQAVKMASMLPLTQLTNLTKLVWACTGEDDDDGDDEEEYAGGHPHMAFISSAETGASPSVWLPLLERCAADDCQVKALRSLAQQLAEQRALNHEQNRLCRSLPYSSSCSKCCSS